jgi:hypothetical protein
MDGSIPSLTAYIRECFCAGRARQQLRAEGSQAVLAASE